MAKSINIAIVVSLCGHLLGFSFIQPSLDTAYSEAKFLKIFFLGSLFDQKEILLPIVNNEVIKEDFLNKKITLNLKTVYLKPHYKGIEFLNLKINRGLFNLNLNNEKKIIYPSPEHYLLKKETPLMFYPYLPYSFLIYFKDRQKAYLEFSFYISKSKLVSINRKITSANLEVDLLVMRYISRSLYLIKDSFPTDCWQTVKIELKQKDAQN